ncbi:MAG: hypothetical protein JNM78_04310 [Cyclobacteriaceae bacterium]|nr:hypothetical protein [Cyclobacteriaceae bacterium]
MEIVSIFTILLFLLTSAGTVWFFYRAANNSLVVLGVLLGWAILQSAISLFGFYQNWDAIPPRFIFLVVPWLILIIILFTVNKGQAFIDRLQIEWLTMLHVVRIPVEITLYLIFLAKLIPESMTFEGRNWDILSGISAPIIYYFVFRIRKINKSVLLIWNFVCLGLLVNVVTIALLAAKTPFQQIDFEQPNIGVAYFPFVLLPCLVVPLVFFSHLAAIRQLLKKLND